MLKYENIETGSYIRAYDFEDRPGHAVGRYIEGEVLRHVTHHGVKFLEICVFYDGMVNGRGRSPYHAGRVGEKGLVPMETDSDEEWSHPRVRIVNRPI